MLDDQEKRPTSPYAAAPTRPEIQAPMSSSSALEAAPNRVISRKRRLSYTRVACDECQRRKTKCTGEQPCKVCRNSNNVCLYKRTTRFRPSDRASHRNVTDIQSASSSSSTATSKKAARASAARTSAPQQQQQQQQQQRQQEGASSDQHRAPPPRSNTSAAAAAAVTTVSSPKPAKVPGPDYYLHLAEKILVTSEPQKRDPQSAKPAPHVSGTLVLEQLILQRTSGSPGSVLALVDSNRWFGITAAYEEEIGLQYPFMDMDQLRRDIQRVSQINPHHGLQQHGDAASREAADLERERVENIAILILAIVSFLVDSDVPKVAHLWVEKTYVETLTRTQVRLGTDPADLSVLILICIFFFLTDREILSWRGIGIVLRLLMEQNPPHSGDASSGALAGRQDPLQADKMFWAVFTLDRRWSFGTGLPFSVHDTEIDRHPILTADSPSSAYVKNMIHYCSIASDVRKYLLDSPSSLGSSYDSTRDLLNFRVDEWEKNLPSWLHFYGAEDMFTPGMENRGHYRIRLVLHLRANQLRIIVHRRWAVRAGPSSLDSSTVNALARAAHDTIGILVRLAHDTDIYQAQHKTFNHFLENALSSLLLVLWSITDEATRAEYTQDVYDALDLIEQLSSGSSISQRLRDKYQGVRDAMNQFRARSDHPQTSAPPPAPPPPPTTSGGEMMSNATTQRATFPPNGDAALSEPLLASATAASSMMERGGSKAEHETGKFSDDVCPGLTPDTFTSNGTFSAMYNNATTSDGTPGAGGNQVFPLANSMVSSMNEFDPAYFPEFGQVLNFCENNFLF